MGCVKRRATGDLIFFGFGVFDEVGCDDAKRSAEPFPPNASAASGGGFGGGAPISLVRGLAFE
jgi:hypothetical protein